MVTLSILPSWFSSWILRIFLMKLCIFIEFRAVGRSLSLRQDVTLRISGNLPDSRLSSRLWWWRQPRASSSPCRFCSSKGEGKMISLSLFPPPNEDKSFAHSATHLFHYAIHIRQDFACRYTNSSAGTVWTPMTLHLLFHSAPPYVSG